MYPFVELQRRRLKFAELGSQLEQFAPRIDPQHYEIQFGSRPKERTSLPAIPIANCGCFEHSHVRRRA